MPPSPRLRVAACEPANHGRIACPTLLIAGEADPVAPVAMARWLADRLDAQLRIHGAGHEIGLTAWSEAIRPRD